MLKFSVKSITYSTVGLFLISSILIFANNYIRYSNYKYKNNCINITYGSTSICVSNADINVKPTNTCIFAEYDLRGKTFPGCVTNYWAGAKKECAMIGMKLPSKEEMKDIYKYNITHNNSFNFKLKLLLLDSNRI